MSRAATALAVAICAAGIAASALIFPARFSDFRAYYCAGRAVVEHTDWAREHPLWECEHGLRSPWQSSLPDDITVPAPYPGYAAAAYGLVARLPFAWAIVVWSLAAALAAGVAMRLLAGQTGLSESGVAAVVVIPAAIVPFPLGQPTPFVLCALVVCAQLLLGARHRLAAAAALVTLLEPHIGLAVCLGLFAAVPAARRVLAAGVTGLALLDVGLFGFAHELAYAREVLPLHALVNVPEFSQFSTANVLWMAGVPARLALAGGDLWYAAALVAGVCAALRMRARLGPAAAVYAPVALAVIGGSYTHLQQLALATPLCLLMIAAAHGARRAFLVAVTFGIAIPWLIAGPSPPLYPVIAVAAFAFTRACGTPKLGLPLAAAGLAVAGGVCWAILAFPSVNPPVAPVTGNPLAEVAWGHFVATTSVPVHPWFVIGKAPTFAALLALLALLGRDAWTALAGRLTRPADAPRLAT